MLHLFFNFQLVFRVMAPIRRGFLKQRVGGVGLGFAKCKMEIIEREGTVNVMGPDM
jgi:hypothetical protein